MCLFTDCSKYNIHIMALPLSSISFVDYHVSVSGVVTPFNFYYVTAEVLLVLLLSLAHAEFLIFRASLDWDHYII